MSRKLDLVAARINVIGHLEVEVRRRREIVAMHERGSVGDAYRREIARLWRVALRAVKAASV